jgi:transposase
LFGAFSPINGNSLVLEMPFCNTSTMQAFLDELSEMDKQELKIVVLDNASFHHSKSLHIPDNIRLIFLPPYSPELNPAEKFWWVIKNKTSLKVYPSIDQLSQHLTEIICSFTTDSIKQLTNFDYIQKAYQTIYNV